LVDVPLLSERFDLVWGPAAYRAPLTVFDQNVMYVVKERAAPRYVVAVRGTNPVSLIDWVFGDLWTGLDVRWPLGSQAGYPDARISLSSHLALNILRHLRSSGPRPTAASRIWRLIDEYPGEFTRRSSRAVLRPIGKPASSVMRRVGLQVRSDLRKLRLDREVLAGLSLEERVAAMVAMRASAPAVRMADRLRSSEGSAVAQRDLLRLLEGSFRLRSRLAPGPNLTHFLRAALETAPGEVEVAVTGHSKGGALSSTLALWLAQTQGTDGVAPVQRWDPHRQATVRCWSYAGPTAGNATFAELSDSVIGDRCFRFSNTLDMVPHAWQARPGGRKVDGFYVENVPQLYGRSVHGVPGLAELARVVARDVRPLDYRHVGRNVVVLPGEVHPEKRLFTDQTAYQHMEAYLIGLGMGEYADTLSLFSV
jgi:hypothetical protein